MTGAAVSRTGNTSLLDYIGREVHYITTADIILIFIGIIGLMISFGSLIVAFLTFFDKSKSHRDKSKK